MTIEEHRQKFDVKVLEMQEKKGKNRRMLTKEYYDQTVRRLNPSVGPLLNETK